MRIQVDTEKSFGNDAFDESPILAPPPVAQRPRESLLPPYLKAKDSKSTLPLSVSEFHEVEHHSRNSFKSSAYSTTRLLSIKRKPSRYHGMRVKQNNMPSLSQAILPATELNRQFESSDPQNVMGHSFYLDLPVAEANAAKPTLQTVSLSPAPLSAVASIHSPSPVAPKPAKSATASPIRQFTLAFGRRDAGPSLDHDQKMALHCHRLFLSSRRFRPFAQLRVRRTSATTNAARMRISSAGPTEEHRFPQISLMSLLRRLFDSYLP